MLTCPNCGAENAPEDRFCGNCGLAVPTAEGHSAVAAARAGAPGGDAPQQSPGDSSAIAHEDETEEPSGGDTSAVGAPEEEGTSEEFQPTLIESHGGTPQPSTAGGGAAAATAASPDSSGLPGDRQSLRDGDEVIVGKTFLRFHVLRK